MSGLAPGPTQAIIKPGMTSFIEIAVIGGGPKAAALAAKAATLKKLELGDIRITIFEPQEIGANWTGRHGYTDGKQLLCTPVERDLGFPYESMYGRPMDRLLYADYSWASYNVHASQEYRKWVDSGRKPPSHSDFARYLSWVVEKTKCKVKKEKVCAIREESGKWEISTGDPTQRSPTVFSTLFDGVVVTGPGHAKVVSIKKRKGSLAANRIFDGLTFWQNLQKIKKHLSTHADKEIVVIGGGGTGAAVLAWLARNGYHERELRLIADQATLFSRGDSVFENRLFSDEEAWKDLSPKNREHFFARLNRGVVWNAIMEDLSIATSLVFIDARAQIIDATTARLLVTAEKEWLETPMVFEPSIVIDASGFDAWWFVNLLSEDNDLRSTVIRRKDELKDKMTASLVFSEPLWKFPPLHAPMLSSNVGPGFGSLMSLGGMSDRILGHYIVPPEPLRAQIPDA